MRWPAEGIEEVCFLQHRSPPPHTHRGGMIGPGRGGLVGIAPLTTEQPIFRNEEARAKQQGQEQAGHRGAGGRGGGKKP